MNNTPQTLKGFRDFLPEQKQQRDQVLQKITETFKTYGFSPLETPTLEYASLLLGKYGEEADKLVYTFKDKGERLVGLRYDQTVPTARVLGQYHQQLPRYFRRYQTQNVFRADKPQKGRYREFTQCDIDIFGSTSPLADAEVLACTFAAYKNIGFSNIKIKVNDRNSLISILEPFQTESVSVFSIIQSLDKLDKVPKAVVIQELRSKGIAEAESILNQVTATSLPGTLREIIELAISLGVDSQSIEFDPVLARGLDYYTGMIFEVIIEGFDGGSVGGGGRYDNLIGELSGVDTPAVGMAFGFDRTVEAAISLGLIDKQLASTSVLVTIFDEKSLPYSLETARNLRNAGIPTEVYPAIEKLQKQLKLANQKSIPYVVIIGEQEITNNEVVLKSMITGEQWNLSVDEAITKLTGVISTSNA